jgi:Uma2 family endonuclease
METLVTGNIYSVEEYFALEEKSEVRHEFIHGQLFEMPGGTTEHHLMVKRLNRFFEDNLEKKGYTIFRETMKVALPGSQQYFYPDLFATKEKHLPENRYAKKSPELIVEVTSDSTLKTDTIDKLIAYQKMPSLQYYLIVNPQLPEVAVFSKTANGGWLSEAYSQKEDMIPLPMLGVEVQLGMLYE